MRKIDSRGEGICESDRVKKLAISILICDGDSNHPIDRVGHNYRPSNGKVYSVDRL